MKKLFLASLVAVALMLPAMNFTSQAAGSFNFKRVVTFIEGWVLFATSNADEGQIKQINVYRLTTGELVKSQQCGGYDCSVSLKDLPKGAYSAMIVCEYTSYSKQFKL
ncbi:MAG: hypothetical protein RLZZ367_790 [Bacteroidota bacterium]|jgi:hypothetical protein